MKRESVRERAAQIYSAIMAAEWSFDTPSEKLLSVAVDAAILFESRVDAEIEAKMTALDAAVDQPEDSTKTAPKEITIDMELPAKVRAKHEMTYYCGEDCRPFQFLKGFVGQVLEVNPANKSILLAFGTEKDWFPLDVVKRDFELCESQS